MLLKTCVRKQSVVAFILINGEKKPVNLKYNNKTSKLFWVNTRGEIYEAAWEAINKCINRKFHLQGHKYLIRFVTYNLEIKYI